MSSGPNRRLEQLSGQLKGPSADRNQPTELPQIRQIAGDPTSQYVYLLSRLVLRSILDRLIYQTEE